MDGIIEYISSPETIVTFAVFVFWLWATWSSLNWRIKTMEKQIEEMERKLDELQKIQQILSHMQADIDWIKKTMQK